VETSRQRQERNPRGHVSESLTASAFREFCEHQRWSHSLLAEWFGDSLATVQRIMSGRVALTSWRVNLLPRTGRKLWESRCDAISQQMGIED
jgi:hypothetical protein